jgi:hypothetical protein
MIRLRSRVGDHDRGVAPALATRDDGDGVVFARLQSAADIQEVVLVWPEVALLHLLAVDVDGHSIHGTEEPWRYINTDPVESKSLDRTGSRTGKPRATTVLGWSVQRCPN